MTFQYPIRFLRRLETYLLLSKPYYYLIHLNMKKKVFLPRSVLCKMKGDYVFLLNVIWRISTLWKKEIANHKILIFCKVIQDSQFFFFLNHKCMDECAGLHFFLKSLVLDIVCTRSD